MPITDLPLSTLVSYRSEQKEPEDFDAFWTETLRTAREAPTLPVTCRQAASPVTELVVEELIFPGWAGEPVHAWVTRPHGVAPRPAVIEYLGYGGGRGLPGDRVRWATAGYVHVVMDTRGQGSRGDGATTPDPHGSDPSVPGFLTRGILDRDDFYYRRLYVDAVRLVDAVRELAFVDAGTITVTGNSQGGGIAIAVAGLVAGLSAVMPDVPFLCHFPRGVDITPRAPLTEITSYLSIYRDHAAAVFRTLSYFDGVFFARRISAPTIFSVALMDNIVMPSTVFAAYNEVTVEDRTIEVYSYNNHEGGQGYQWRKQAEWLQVLLSRDEEAA